MTTRKLRVDTSINEKSCYHAKHEEQTVWALILVSSPNDTSINGPLGWEICIKNELHVCFGFPRLCKKLYERRWAKVGKMKGRRHVIRIQNQIFDVFPESPAMHAQCMHTYMSCVRHTLVLAFVGGTTPQTPGKNWQDEGQETCNTNSKSNL